MSVNRRKYRWMLYREAVARKLIPGRRGGYSIKLLEELLEIFDWEREIDEAEQKGDIKRLIYLRQEAKYGRDGHGTRLDLVSIIKSIISDIDTLRPTGRGGNNFTTWRETKTHFKRGLTQQKWREFRNKQKRERYVRKTEKENKGILDILFGTSQERRP